MNQYIVFIGGIFKETDCGKWVHLVCALYIPGICVREVTGVIKLELFKNATPRWGNKKCTLCTDFRFSSTGVTIACDAGMCRASFHVTWYDVYIFNHKSDFLTYVNCNNVFSLALIQIFFLFNKIWALLFYSFSAIRSGLTTIII